MNNKTQIPNEKIICENSMFVYWEKEKSIWQGRRKTKRKCGRIGFAGDREIVVATDSIRKITEIYENSSPKTKEALAKHGIKIINSPRKKKHGGKKMRTITILIALFFFATIAVAADCNNFTSIDQNGTKLYKPDINGSVKLCGFFDYNSLAVDLNQANADINLYRAQCNERINNSDSAKATAIQEREEFKTQNDTLTGTNMLLRQQNADLNNEYISKTNSCLAQITKTQEATNALNTTAMAWMLGDKAAYEQKINGDNKTIFNDLSEIKLGVIIIAILVFLYFSSKFAPRLLHKVEDKTPKRIETLAEIRDKKWREEMEKKLETAQKKEGQNAQ